VECTVSLGCDGCDGLGANVPAASLGWSGRCKQSCEWRGRLNGAARAFAMQRVIAVFRFCIGWCCGRVRLQARLPGWQHQLVNTVHLTFAPSRGGTGKRYEGARPDGGSQRAVLHPALTRNTNSTAHRTTPTLAQTAVIHIQRHYTRRAASLPRSIKVHAAPGNRRAAHQLCINRP
jgi:hypothetical protein